MAATFVDYLESVTISIITVYELIVVAETNARPPSMASLELSQFIRI